MEAKKCCVGAAARRYGKETLKGLAQGAGVVKMTGPRRDPQAEARGLQSFCKARRLRVERAVEAKKCCVGAAARRYGKETLKGLAQGAGVVKMTGPRRDPRAEARGLQSFCKARRLRVERAVEAKKCCVGAAARRYGKETLKGLAQGAGVVKMTGPRRDPRAEARVCSHSAKREDCASIMRLRIVCWLGTYAPIGVASINVKKHRKQKHHNRACKQ